MNAAQILLVEDDRELRAVIQRGLEEEGFNVSGAGSGAEAMEQISADAPDALVIDIGLPDADGRDLCQAVRARGIQAPVLFLTARDALADRLAGFGAGGDDYLTKPFSLAELCARLRAVLNRAGVDGTVNAAGLSLDPTTLEGLVRGAQRPAHANRVPPARRAGRATRAGGQPPRARARRLAGGGSCARQHDRRLPRAPASQAANARRGAGDHDGARRRLPLAMRLRRLSLRSRLTAGALAGAAIALTVLIAAFNLVLDARLRTDADNVLRERAVTVLRGLGTVDGRLSVIEAPDVGAVDAQTWIFAGERTLEQPALLDPRNQQAVLMLIRARTGFRTVDSTDTRLLAVPARQAARRLGTVVVGASVAPYESTASAALLGSVILGVILIAAIAALSRWLISRARRPVARMTAEAADWGERDLSRRFVAGEPHDELSGSRVGVRRASRPPGPEPTARAAPHGRGLSRAAHAPCQDPRRGGALERPRAQPAGVPRVTAARQAPCAEPSTRAGDAARLRSGWRGRADARQ